MTYKRAFLIIETILILVIAGLLAGGALIMYMDGASKQAAGDLFRPIYTRESAAAALLPVLPLCLCAAGLAAAGNIMGIRDEKADMPVRDETLLRSLSRAREKAVAPAADRRTRFVRAAVLLISVLLIVAGILNGGLKDVLIKGITLCSECIGLG